MSDPITPGSDLPPGLRTCKTCRWWEELTEGSVTEGQCRCREIDDLRSGVFALEGDITTGPDFGCVHHEEKE